MLEAIHYDVRSILLSMRVVIVVIKKLVAGSGSINLINHLLHSLSNISSNDVSL